MIEIEAPDGSVAEFPDGTADAVIERAMKEAFPQPKGAMQVQRDKEAAWNDAHQRWIQATGGTIPPGKNVRQAVAEWAKLEDPMKTRDSAVTEHIRETGEVPEDTEQDLDMQVLKPLAGMIGYGIGLGPIAGPTVATAAEGAVRYQSLKRNLDRAVKAGAVEQERADEILHDAMTHGSKVDAAWNFGVPVVGGIAAKIAKSKLVQRLPGVRAATDKISQALGSDASEAAQREAKVEKRAAQAAENPDVRGDVVGTDAAGAPVYARQEAVRKLAEKSRNDILPAPGSARGDAGTWETLVRKGNAPVFKEVDQELEKSADKVLRDVTAPESTLGREDLGNTVVETARGVEKAMKARLRPIWEKADDLGVKVDMSSTRYAASKALAEDSQVPGGALKEAERKALAEIYEFLRPSAERPSAAVVSPAAALDFISARKAALRATVKDGEPSKPFTTVTNRLIRTAERNYDDAAKIAGQPGVARDLRRARKEYALMMDTVYQGSVKKALKKEAGGSAEDIGQMLWSGGNVGEIRQVHRLLAMASNKRLSVLGDAGVQKVKSDLARGFLQDAVKNTDDAARWTQNLRENTKRADTWRILTSGTEEGKALDNLMKVAEQAAQVAKKTNIAMAGVPVQAERVVGGGLGVTSSTIHAGWLAVVLSASKLTKLAATAYTHGNTGALNNLIRIIKLKDVKTGAGVQALEKSIAELKKWAAENNVELPEEEKK